MAERPPRSLAAKLGLKAGMKVLVLEAPMDYRALVAPLPEGVLLTDAATGPVDMVHLFTTDHVLLRAVLPGLMEQIRPAGTIWVSWPKQAAKVPTSVDGHVIRAVALPLGLVDVKVCAVDAVWAGQKLVIRRHLR